MQLAPRSAQPVSGRRGQAVHAQQKHGGSQLLQEPPRPVKSTGRRRGKALLRDVALKPMEKDDELLSQIASDLRSAVEVGAATASAGSALPLVARPRCHVRLLLAW